MVNNTDFRKAVDLINKSDSILLTTHTKLEGEACEYVAVLYDGFPFKKT